MELYVMASAIIIVHPGLLNLVKMMGSIAPRRRFKIKIAAPQEQPPAQVDVMLRVVLIYTGVVLDKE